MYYDFNRDIEENEIVSELSSPSELYKLETFDLPTGCPYRQFIPSGPFPPLPPFLGGSQSGQGTPYGPPPDFIPTRPQTQDSLGGIGIQAVDPGAIRPCTFRFVYIWLTNRRAFWAYLTYIGRRSAAGFRWNGRRWVYFGIDLRRIDSFYCY
jgi:hypothetical protein